MLQHIALPMRRVTLLSVAAVLSLVAVVPALVPSLVLAAPAVQERELQSTSAIPGGTSNLTWIFDTTSIGATNVEQIEIEFCDSPLSSCTNVDGDGSVADTTGASIDNIPLLPGSPTATLTGPWTSTGNTASRVDGRNANTAGSGNQINIVKTTADDTNNKDELHIAVPGFTNDNIANRSYYTRMRLYSDTGTTLVWEGVFAQSTSQTLTVNARVQERLDFCVGSTTVNNATTTPGADCSAITGTNVDIGNVENGFSNVSPVLAINGGNDSNGVAMVRTNAVNGVVVDYKSIQENGSGALKVIGATCTAETAVDTTDQCFNSADTGSDPSNGATATTITAATEKFGMTVAGVNCGSSTAYGCTFTTGVYNLVRDSEYDGNGANTFVADSNQVAGTTSAQYAWLSNGVADRIASSASSAVKVVDDEALILKFAATAGVTTPTGAYQVQADYIATATF